MTTSVPLAAPLPRIIVEQDVVIPLRDGTRTVADVFRYDDDVRRPVVLQRSIYGKHGYMEHAYPGPMAIVRAGYAYVSQDCRGCGGSDGFLDFFHQEQDDGYDSVEWAAVQPWSSGRVGVIGNSALTMTALQAVAAQPPSLAAAFVVDGHTDMESWTHRSGVPSEVYFAAQFMGHMVSLNNLRRLDLGEKEYAELVADVGAALATTREDLLGLPLLDIPGLGEDRVTSGLRSIFLAGPSDQVWERDRVALGKDPGRARVPIKAVTGVHSPFVASLLGVWAGGDPALGHEILVGPWGHYGTVGAPSGTHDYLDAPAGGRKVWGTALIGWFDRWLKGGVDEVPAERSMHYFLTGEQRWAQSDVWPPPGIKRELFFGPGDLVASPPVSGARDYRYDPADPAPTRGGVVIDIGQVSRFDRTLTADGPHDQRPLEGRGDVLVYRTPVLEEATRVVGPASATVWLSSSAEDTDVIVRVLDVEPDGFAGTLAEGIVRARHRAGGDDAWLVPGEPTELTVEIAPIVHTFLPGHRIAVHVTSSSFPKYSRNLNARVVPEVGTTDDIVVADQRVHHGGARPSCLRLHVVETTVASTPYRAATAARPTELDSESANDRRTS